MNTVVKLVITIRAQTVAEKVIARDKNNKNNTINNIVSKAKPGTEQINENKQANINKSFVITALTTLVINNTENNKDNDNNNKLFLTEAIS